MVFDIIEIFSVLMFFISFYGLITSKSIIKSVVSILLMESAVIMFFLSIGYTSGIMPPIGQNPETETVADPLPQALMITAIIIGVAVVAVNLIMLISLYRQCKAKDWDAAKKKSME
ncbi:MAG: cation:proton antiporter subunit C [Oscillospiraceae bacterium]|nr:cation:proton antiporter subunit C [Oscillospiraceae bacterium]